MISEAIGAEVSWDNPTRTATVVLNSLTFSVAIGQATVCVNGQTIALDGTVSLVDGRTQVPLSLFTACLGLAPDVQQSAQAVAFIAALSKGQGADYAAQMSPALAQATPAAKMLALGAGLTRVYGDLQQARAVGYTTNDVHVNVSLVAGYAKLPMSVTVRFTPAGLIDDLYIAPYTGSQPAPVPSYADPSSYTEQNVVVGEGAFALPGTLTLPKGAGPFPAVVLLHGSGPNDRDVTVGGVKLFRDLADGLASRGIAVLRYDKQTLENSLKCDANPRFSLQDETINDALAAVDLLAENGNIDVSRIFLLGHSLSGFALPQILKQETGVDLAGGICMAGPNSMLDTLIAQNRILIDAGLLPPQQLPFITGQVDILRDPSFDPAAPPATFVLGAPYYYASWRGTASDFLTQETAPLLFLQGERDCQVPASLLDSWRSALSERTDVTYKLYPKLNHVFTEGEGPLGLPAEYNTPANVPVYVVDDLANWINAQR
jgi:dienelactone hydrolase